MTLAQPEILAPVGDWEMCRAAVHNGADAVYLGMPGFNARGRAKTFSLDELRQMIEFCHLYGVKVLLAFNVLIFERELQDAEALLRDVLPLAPDALIVQDLGLVRLIRALAPNQVVHASTQMTVTCHEAIELTSDLGIKRYVLARELALPEIARIKENTSQELEVFVHGALCVAYSGQCLTSESFGGRSANRGQCAQACRLPYELIVDGEVRDLGERRYLVSPKDLCGLDEIPELTRLGISSFKIEGRLKTPEYVAETVRAYRERRDDARKAPTSLSTLQLAYSRGFFSGWLNGVNHQKLVDGRYSNHHGIEAGEVVASDERSVVVRSERTPLAGDGVVFADFSNAKEIGAKIFEVAVLGDGRFRLRFDNQVRCATVRRGMKFFINSSDGSMREVRHRLKTQLRRVPLTARVYGSVGTNLILELSDDAAHTVRAESASTLQQARSAALDPEALRAEIGALGGTPYVLTNLECAIEGSCFIHNRELKQLRRQAIEQITALRSCRGGPAIASAEILKTFTAETSPATKPARPQLFTLLRDASQIEAVADLTLDGVYLDFEFGKDYAPSVERLRALGHHVGIATTRILKPGETGHLKVIDRLRPDMILVRNLGALQFFQGRGHTLIGDFSLNVTNSLTAHWLLTKQLAALTPSYDLNRDQLLDLAERCRDVPLEVTIHQYMPSFHMEHCVFAAFLSSGTSFRDCGRPCEKHRVELRDHSGVLHPLKPDAECRNTMFNGAPQSAGRLVPDLLTNGVARYRVEALYETPGELRRKLEAYGDLIAGRCSMEELVSRVGALERYGVTDGQLYNIRGWQDRKKEPNDTQHRSAEVM